MQIEEMIIQHAIKCVTGLITTELSLWLNIFCCMKASE